MRLKYSHFHQSKNYLYSKPIKDLKGCGISYRFSFNGKEKIDEINGAGNNLDFGARIYDARLGRWMSMDPLWSKYPELSAYNFAGNCPILFLDVDGEKFINPYRDKIRQLETSIENEKKVYEQFKKDNPTLKPRALKQSEAAIKLMNLQYELERNREDAQEVDDYLHTLEVTNKGEYDRLNTLKDGKGDKIDIRIDLAGQNPKGSAVGTNEGLALYEGNIPTTANNSITITLYESGQGVDLSNQTQYQSGRNYLTFANELGDITYFFDRVTNQYEREKWDNSKGNTDPNYRTDQTGAGVCSNEYQDERVADVKRYVKNGLKKDETHNNVKQTIEKR